MRDQVVEWVNRLTPLFQAAGEADRNHSEEFKKGIAAYGLEQYKASQLYGETLEHFWKTTDAVNDLINGAQTKLVQGDVTLLPLILAYLNVPARYFRSGYRRAQLWRILKLIPPNEEMNAILRDIIIEQVQAGGGEYREATRWIPRISTPDFESKLRKLESEQNPVVQRRIRRILRLYFPSKGRSGPGPNSGASQP